MHTPTLRIKGAIPFYFRCLTTFFMTSTTSFASSRTGTTVYLNLHYKLSMNFKKFFTLNISANSLFKSISCSKGIGLDPKTAISISLILSSITSIPFLISLPTFAIIPERLFYNPLSCPVFPLSRLHHTHDWKCFSALSYQSISFHQRLPFGKRPL